MKITKLFVLILLCQLLCGCHLSKVSREIEQIDIDRPMMFVNVEDTVNWSVYYHKDTKVMYVCSKGMYNRGNMTVMLDADGKPLLWEGSDYE